MIVHKNIKWFILLQIFYCACTCKLEFLVLSTLFKYDICVVAERLAQMVTRMHRCTIQGCGKVRFEIIYSISHLWGCLHTTIDHFLFSVGVPPEGLSRQAPDDGSRLGDPSRKSSARHEDARRILSHHDAADAHLASSVRRHPPHSPRRSPARHAHQHRAHQAGMSVSLPSQRYISLV